jgi:UDP-2,3-diacylglucosamine pyrophosphatase LpxH
MIDTPQLEEPIRILSDLHFGHPASIIERAEQLTPLFRDAKTVIFNGDTVELRFLRGRRIGKRNGLIMRETCEAAGARPIFLNGNHDPIMSDLSHVDLFDGAVLVTHGDLLFHDISPWSHDSHIIAAAHSIELRRPRMWRDSLSSLRTVLRECWPPWRPFQIFHSWAVTPALAESLARVFRPEARFILIGHTHFCGHWRRGPRVIINTGSFLPLSGRMAIDIADGTLTLRPILMDRSLFKAGAPMLQFPISKLSPAESH